MIIAVSGMGYVGVSIAHFLARHHYVTAVDVVHKTVGLMNSGKSSVRGIEIEEGLASG